jgi:hypothetical protein
MTRTESEILDEIRRLRTHSAVLGCLTMMMDIALAIGLLIFFIIAIVSLAKTILCT